MGDMGLIAAVVVLVLILLCCAWLLRGKNQRARFGAWVRRQGRRLNSKSLWFNIATAIVVFGSLYLAYSSLRKFIPATSQTAWDNAAYFSITLLSIGIPAFLSTINFYRRGIVVAIGTLESWRFLAPVVLLFVVAAVSIAIVEPGTWTGSIGIIFPIVAASITVAGFLFTLNKLDDILSRILSYDVLVDRLSEMIEREIYRVQNEKRPGRIYIIANSVTFGNISAHYKYYALLDELFEAFNNDLINVRIICRDWEWWAPENMIAEDKAVPINPQEILEKSLDEIKNTPLGRLYWNWSGSGNWDDENLKKPYYQAIALLDVLRRARVRSQFDVRKQAYVLPSPTAFAPLHMVITSNRALLFHVIDFPTRSNQHVPAKIHVIGTETGDPSIVERLEQAFNYHAEHSTTGCCKIDVS